MGYHTREFVRGTFGDFDKIAEEWEELVDAHEQSAKILELCEIADLYGALEGYLKKHHGLGMHDVALMARMTREAFEEGKRRSG